VIHYGPAEDFETIDVGLIREAAKQIYMAAYVLTDRAVIDELREAAERGGKVRIWRDASEAARLSDFDVEAQLGGQVQGLEIRSNAPGGELMHLKGYCELHMALREALDREASPTAAILDSQSLKAAMARPRQDPPALSMAGTYLGRRRLQRPSGQGCRGQIAGAPARNRQAHRRHQRLRRPAPEMGRRANLLMVRPQPPSRQRLPEPRRNSSRVRNPRRNPIRHQTLGPQVAF